MPRFLAVTCILLSLLALTTPNVYANVSASPTGEVLTFGTAIFTTPGKVNILIPLSNGKMLAGGSFIALGGGAAPHSLAVLNSDGSLDATFHADADLQVLEVKAAAIQTDSKIVLAGWFRLAGDTITYSYLRLNANGSIDDSFYLYAFLNGQVYTVLIDGTKILLGGNFTSPTTRIGRLDSTGHVDASFNGVGTGANGIVRGLAKQGSQYLLAGDFTAYNGTGRVGLARINANGSLDTTFAPVGSILARTVAVLNDNSVVVGSEDICNMSRTTFKWYTSAGMAKSTTVSDPNLFDSISALLPLTDGGFLIGGWRSHICFGSSPDEHEGEIWRFASDGSYSTMTSFGNESDVLALGKRSDGKVVVGGQGRPSQTDQIGIFDGLALLDLTYGLDKVTSYHPIVGDQAEIYDISQYVDGRLLVGGNFTHANEQPRFGLARLLANGSLDTTFKPFAEDPGGYSQVVLALPDGRAVAGFVHNNLFLISNSGALTDLSTYVEYFQTTTMERQNDGKILVAGGFGVRRVKADFSGLDTTFAQADSYGTVYDLALQTDNKILVAGDFSSYGGGGYPELLRLKNDGVNDGAIDSTFVPPAFLDDVDNAGTLYSVSALTGGKILVGGYFEKVGGAVHPSLARLNSNGSLDTSFTSPTVFHLVRSTCTLGDASIWVGGTEESIDRNPLVRRLAQNGMVDAAYGDNYQNAHGDGTISKLLCNNDGITWGGGAFNMIENVPYYSLARYLQVNAQVFLPLVVR